MVNLIQKSTSTNSNETILKNVEITKQFLKIAKSKTINVPAQSKLITRQIHTKFGECGKNKFKFKNFKLNFVSNVKIQIWKWIKIQTQITIVQLDQQNSQIGDNKTEMLKN